MQHDHATQGRMYNTSYPNHEAPYLAITEDQLRAIGRIPGQTRDGNALLILVSGEMTEIYVNYYNFILIVLVVSNTFKY